jgi:hypothetical protein
MIAAFIAERMSAYIAGGTIPADAARLTMGELGAIYRGNHYSRGASGAFRLTPPPEALGIVEAKKKASAALSEFMKATNESRAGQVPDNAPREIYGALKKSGLEGLKNYARGNTA